MRIGRTLISTLVSLTVMSALAITPPAWADDSGMISYDAETDTLQALMLPQPTGPLMPGDVKEYPLDVHVNNSDDPVRISVKAEAEDPSLTNVIDVTLTTAEGTVTSDLLDQPEGITLMESDGDTSMRNAITIRIPETIGNEANGLDGSLRWTITATEEDGTGDTTIVEPDHTGRQPDTGTNDIDTIPQTGSSITIILISSIILLATGMSVLPFFGGCKISG